MAVALNGLYAFPSPVQAHTAVVGTVLAVHQEKALVLQHVDLDRDESSEIGMSCTIFCHKLSQATGANGSVRRKKGAKEEGVAGSTSRRVHLQSCHSILS